MTSVQDQDEGQHQQGQQHQFVLGDTPTDGISSVFFSPYGVDSQTSTRLLVASWDRTCRLYDVLKDVCLADWAHDGAVLDTCFGPSDISAFSVGLDKTILYSDLTTDTRFVIGTHDDAIRCCRFNSQINTLITGSWDGTVQLWDARSQGSASNNDQSSKISYNHIGRYDQGNKVFSLDTQGNRLVVATAGRIINVYDLRNMKTSIQKRESPLKLMTRAVRCMPNEEGFAIGSIEGRVAIEYFDMSSKSQQRKYGFKCHRKPSITGDGDDVYPVNALSFHPIYGTFASGGSDGTVCIWDGINKKRLKQYSNLPCGISSLSFSSNGQLLAIASSPIYDQSQENLDIQASEPIDSRLPRKNCIIIRRVGRQECRPKLGK